MSEVSEFFLPSSQAADHIRGLNELIFESPNGYTQIWKAIIDGRYRIFKSLKDEYRGNAVFEALLKKEFEIGHRLTHQNICEYIAFSSRKDIGNCIELEWIDGCTLEECMDEIRTDSKLRDKIILEICEALKYIHSKQTVHRDIKPENIMVTRNGRNVKMLDFGLADSDSHTFFKEPAGTIVYAAPEVLSGGIANCRSDIYSFGVILNEIGGNRRIHRIARKCMNDDPADRFPDVQSLQTAIQHKPRITIITLTVLSAVLILILLYRTSQERNYDPSEIDSIFEEATRIVEEADR